MNSELGLTDDASRYFTAAANDLRAADRARANMQTLCSAKLAATLRLKGELREAEELLQSSLATRTQVFGNSGAMVSESLQGLAELRMLQQRWSEAEELLRQAIVSYAAFVRCDTQQLAHLKTTLAGTPLRHKHAEEAGSLLASAIAISNAMVPRCSVCSVGRAFSAISARLLTESYRE